MTYAMLVYYNGGDAIRNKRRNMTTWFTSDPHFNHRNIIHLCGRPFDSVEEMNEALVANFNSVVRPGDDLYILGDVAYKGSADELLPRLNGKLHLIVGNHDKDYSATGFFEDIAQIRDISLGIKGRNYRFALCHYPLAEWNGFYRGAVHLHGHQHNKSDYNLAQKEAGLLRYDVGVDANGFFPVSAQQIIEFFELG